MKNHYLLIILSFLISCKINAQKENEDNNYIFKKGSFEGIGKWYQDREIAHVMGFQGITWLERDTREEEENTSTLIKNMEIRSSDHIADIGAGSGYHVFKMAKIASKGMIYAVDIQPEMLEVIKNGKIGKEIDNITLVQGSESSVNLPENALDKVLMVDVYHEFNNPKEMALSIKRSLKSDGKLYLIEYRSEDPNVPIKELHKMSEKQSIKEMKEAGFKLEKNIRNLSWQHCMIFVKE